MRRATALSIAATAALCTLLAFSGSASATALCQVEVTECPLVSTYPAETVIGSELASGSSAIFKTSLGNLTCTATAMTLNTSEEEAEALAASLTELTFSGCTMGETSCSVTASNLPYAAEITYTEGFNGSIALSNGGKGEPGAVSKCGLITCELTGSPSIAIESGEPAALSVVEAKFSSKGFLCSKEAVFTTKYSNFEPEIGVFVDQVGGGATKLCKVNPPENPGTQRLRCPNNPNDESYGGEIRGGTPVGGANPELYSSLDTTKKVLCTVAKFSGNFLATGGPAATNGGIQKLEFSGTEAGGQCGSTLTGENPPVKVVMDNLPYTRSNVYYKGLESPQGGLTITGSANNKPVRLKLEVNGATPVVCQYKRLSLAGIVSHQNPSILGVQGVWERDAGANPPCPQLLSQRYTTLFNRPNGLLPDETVWVAGE